MSSPFQSPDEQYFQQLENKLNRIPTWQSPTMETPDHYFDRLEEQILQKNCPAPSRVRPMWIRWAAAAVVFIIGAGYYFMPASSSPWQDFSNEDLVVYLEDHQTTLPWEEMASQVEIGTLVPLNEISDQDIEKYEEIYGI